MDELQAQVDTGRIAFVPCSQDRDGWAPATVLPHRAWPLVLCGVCSETFYTNQIEWVTPEEALQRFGWAIAEEGVTP